MSSSKLGLQDIHIFIISWTGMHQNCQIIAKEISGHGAKVTIVYSDKDVNFKHPFNIDSIRTHDGLYWGGKFKVCIDNLDSKVLLIIQGDVACDNWKALLINCIDSFNHAPKIAHWAPMVDYTFFNLEKTKIANIKNTTLSIVSLADLIVFAVKHDVVSRMKKLEYESNVYGWGIDWIISAYIYVTNRIAVVDSRVKVSHPKGTGYDSKEANLQMQQFLKQMSMEECIQYRLLKNYTYTANKL